MKTSTLKTLNAIALLAVLVVNYLANALPINGILTGAISDKYANQFAPAGITFSIWGIIYSLLIAVLVWQFVSRNNLKEEAIDKIGFWWIANSMLNVIWLFLWHYELLAVSVLVMLGILFTLVQLNTVISMKIVPNTPAKTLLKAGFGVYLGWICIATIANVTTWLVSIGWNALGFSATFWTGGLIGVGSIIASLITIKFKNLFIGSAVVWAFIGIIIKQNQLHNDFTPISWAAMTWALPVLIAMLYSKTFKQ